MSHSNSKLELIYHLLNESNNIYQAYHQVPEDVRRRWEPPRYFPEEYVDTHRLTLEVQTELNWSDELTKDVAQRIAEKQDYNLIVKEMKRKYGVDVLGGVAIIYTCYNAERDGVTLNELFWGNPIDVPTVKGGGFIGPSLGLKKPGLNNMNTEMPKETPKPPNPPNTSNKNPVFGADWNEFLQSKYGKNAVEWVSKGTLKAPKKLGTGKVGDFSDIEGASIDDILSRIPENATRRELTPIEGKVMEGFEYKWVQDGKTMRVRVHGPDASAPAGSNAANGWIVRVQEGKKYYDPVTGEFQPPGISNVDSPFYNEDIANRTHIPIKTPE